MTNPTQTEELRAAPVVKIKKPRRWRRWFKSLFLVGVIALGGVGIAATINKSLNARYTQIAYEATALGQPKDLRVPARLDNPTLKANRSAPANSRIARAPIQRTFNSGLLPKHKTIGEIRTEYSPSEMGWQASHDGVVELLLQIPPGTDQIGWKVFRIPEALRGSYDRLVVRVGETTLSRHEELRPSSGAMLGSTSISTLGKSKDFGWLLNGDSLRLVHQISPAELKSMAEQRFEKASHISRYLVANADEIEVRVGNSPVPQVPELARLNEWAEEQSKTRSANTIAGYGGMLGGPTSPNYSPATFAPPQEPPFDSSPQESSFRSPPQANFGQATAPRNAPTDRDRSGFPAPQNRAGYDNLLQQDRLPQSGSFEVMRPQKTVEWVRDPNSGEMVQQEQLTYERVVVENALAGIPPQDQAVDLANQGPIPDRFLADARQPITQEQARERQAREMAMSLAERLKRQPADARSEEDLNALRESLNAEFETRLAQQMTRLDKAAADLKRTKEILDQRSAQKEAIVQRRMMQLIGGRDPLDWDYAPEPNGTAVTNDTSSNFGFNSPPESRFPASSGNFGAPASSQPNRFRNSPPIDDRASQRMPASGFGRVDPDISNQFEARPEVQDEFMNRERPRTDARFNDPRNTFDNVGVRDDARNGAFDFYGERFRDTNANAPLEGQLLNDRLPSRNGANNLPGFNNANTTSEPDDRGHQSDEPLTPFEPNQVRAADPNSNSLVTSGFRLRAARRAAATLRTLNERKAISNSELQQGLDAEEEAQVLWDFANRELESQLTMAQLELDSAKSTERLDESAVERASRIATLRKQEVLIKRLMEQKKWASQFNEKLSASGDLTEVAAPSVTADADTESSTDDEQVSTEDGATEQHANELPPDEAQADEAQADEPNADTELDRETNLETESDPLF